MTGGGKLRHTQVMQTKGREKYQAVKIGALGISPAEMKICL